MTVVSLEMSDEPKNLLAWQKFPFSPIKHLCPKFKLSSGDEKNIGTEKDDMKKIL